MTPVDWLASFDDKSKIPLVEIFVGHQAVARDCRVIDWNREWIRVRQKGKDAFYQWSQIIRFEIQD